MHAVLPDLKQQKNRKKTEKIRVKDLLNRVNRHYRMTFRLQTRKSYKHYARTMRESACDACTYMCYCVSVDRITGKELCGIQYR